MLVASLQNIAHSYSIHEVLRSVSVTISTGQRTWPDRREWVRQDDPASYSDGRRNAHRRHSGGA